MPNEGAVPLGDKCSLPLFCHLSVVGTHCSLHLLLILLRKNESHKATIFQALITTLFFSP